jgi:hypothetical protein
MINTNLYVGRISSSDFNFKGISSTEFLGLMIEEIKHQDPLNPDSSSDQLQRLSEITSVNNLSEILDVPKRRFYDSESRCCRGDNWPSSNF